MGKLILYGILASPPVRSVMFTLKALELPYEFKVVDLVAGENFSEEFLKMNPQHTVPVLEDDGHYLWESHAIIAYLVGKYSKNDTLYPKDHYQRAVIDQRMHFDTGVAFVSLRNITYSVIIKNELEIPQSKIDAVAESYALLEKFLAIYKYAGADHVTIADFALLPTITSLNLILPIDEKVYPKITAWIANLKKLPYYEEANTEGTIQYRALIFSKNWKVVP